MTLRDWFAGQALAGILSTRDTSAPNELAKYVYEFADAMLAARSEGSVVKARKPIFDDPATIGEAMVRERAEIRERESQTDEPQ